MPNWCQTTYHCKGAADKIQELKQIAEKILSDAKDNGDAFNFGGNWLGNLVQALGYDPNSEEYPCRGELLEVQYDPEHPDTLVLNLETAWKEQPGVRKAIHQAFPDIHVYYYDYEPAMWHYATNDIHHEIADECCILITSDLKYPDDIDEEEILLVDLKDEVERTIGEKVMGDFEKVKEALLKYADEHIGRDHCWNIIRTTYTL